MLKGWRFFSEKVYPVCWSCFFLLLASFLFGYPFCLDLTCSFFFFQMHIQTIRGRILETILSLRFLMFQYGIVYKLHLTGKDTSLTVIFSSLVPPLYFCLLFILAFPEINLPNCQIILHISGLEGGRREQQLKIRAEELTDRLNKNVK